MAITRATIGSAKPRDVLKDTVIIGLELYVGARTKTWRIYYRTNDGRERRQKIGSYNIFTLKEARDEAIVILQQVACGDDPAAKRDIPTLEELYYEFMDEMQKKLKPKTLEGYETAYHKYLKPLAKRPIDLIDSPDIADIHKKSPAYSGNRTLAFVSRLYSYASGVSKKYISTDYNPAKGIERNTEKPRKRVAEPQEMVALGRGIKVWQKDTDYRKRQYADILLLLVLTGARLNEVAASRCEWWHLEEKALKLPDSKTGEKVIELSDDAVSIARRWVASGREYTFQTASRVSPMKTDGWWKEFKDEFKLGEDLRTHDIRRSYASYAKSSGMDIGTIAELLGHASQKTTERSYAFLLNDVKADAAQNVSTKMLEALEINPASLAAQ